MQRTARQRSSRSTCWWAAEQRLRGVLQVPGSRGSSSAGGDLHLHPFGVVDGRAVWPRWRSCLAADEAYKNAQKNNDKQNARIEHDKALARVMNGLIKDDTELFKQFSDNESFKRWLTDSVFA